MSAPGRRPNPLELLDDADRRAALLVTCPHCKAPSPSPCVVPGLRKPKALSAGRMHDSRIQAGRASAPPRTSGGWF